MQQSFHSCAETTLQFYFDSLLNEELPQNILFDVLQQVVKNISYYIKAKNTEIFWKTITSTIDKCLTSKNSVKSLDYLLKLLIQMLEHKEGKMLTSLDLLIKLYLKLIQQDIPDFLLPLVSKFGSLLLNSQNIQIPQENASTIIRKSLSSNSEFFKLDFIKNLITYPQFEVMILPSFLTYFKNNLNESTLKFLTEIVIRKAPISHNGSSFSNWNKYNLDFGPYNDPILNYMLDILDKSNDSPTIFYALICLPHLKTSPGSLEKAIDRLKKLLLDINESINQDKGGELKFLFLVSNILSSLSHMMVEMDFYEFVNENDILMKLLHVVTLEGCTVVVLSILDLILTAARNTEFISMKNLLLLDENLREFFASPFKEVSFLRRCNSCRRFTENF